MNMMDFDVIQTSLDCLRQIIPKTKMDHLQSYICVLSVVLHSACDPDLDVFPCFLSGVSLFSAFGCFEPVQCQASYGQSSESPSCCRR